MPASGRVVGIDHIGELVDQSGRNLVSSGKGALLSSGRVQLRGSEQNTIITHINSSMHTFLCIYIYSVRRAKGIPSDVSI